MSWEDSDYAYAAGWKGEALTPLLDICERIRVLAEVSGGKSGSNVQTSYTHGEKAIPNKYSNGLIIELECTARFTDSAGLVTHVDGESGHVYENVAQLKEIFYGGFDLVTLQRTLPHIGTVDIDVENMTPESITSLQWQFLFHLYAPKPFWQGPTTVVAGAAVAIGGNAPVDDAIVTLGTGTTTHTESGAIITNTGASCDIDMATGKAMIGATDVSDQVSFSDPAYLVLLGGRTNNFTGLAPSISYRPKWRV